MPHSKQRPALTFQGDDDAAAISSETLARLAEAVYIGELRQIDRLVALTPVELPRPEEAKEEPAEDYPE